MGYLTGQVSMWLSRRLARNFKAAGYDVTVEQWRVLVRLWDSDGQNQQALACATGKDKPSITRLIDNLEKNNLLVRVPDANDRRVNLVYLTNKAKELQKELIEIAEKTLQEALDQIQPDEVALCKDVLNKMINNLKVE